MKMLNCGFVTCDGKVPANTGVCNACGYNYGPLERTTGRTTYSEDNSPHPDEKGYIPLQTTPNCS